MALNKIKKSKEKRKFIRIGVKRLTSIIKNQVGFELIEESEKLTTTLINVKDISVGGLRIESKREFKKGLFLDLAIPKVKTLDATVVTCEVTRSEFKDGQYYYDIGVRFRPANTEYLQQLMEIIKAV